MLIAPAKLPIKSLTELIAAVKAKPGEFNYGSAGVGTQPHMAMELFRTMAGLEIQHVPYKGVAPALNAVIAGQVSAAMVNPLSAKSQIDGGTVRGLGITSLKRSAMMPDIPAINEAVPGYEAMQWFGLFAPAGTPAPIVARLHKEIAAALKSPEMQKRIAADGADAVGNTPAEFSAQIKSELDKWAKVAKAAKIGSREISMLKATLAGIALTCLAAAGAQAQRPGQTSRSRSWCRPRRAAAPTRRPACMRRT